MLSQNPSVGLGTLQLLASAWAPGQSGATFAIGIIGNLVII
jgi:hypothetical protein